MHDHVTICDNHQDSIYVPYTDLFCRFNYLFYHTLLVDFLILKFYFHPPTGYNQLHYVL